MGSGADKAVVVLHPAISESGGNWIEKFVPDNSGYVFRLVPAPGAEEDWHKGSGRTSSGGWKNHFRHAAKGLRERPDAVVTNFPQLVFAVCLLRPFLSRKSKVIGWSFNFGQASKDRIAKLYGAVFRRANLLIVHSSEEIDRYSKAFGLPADKMKFVPLQVGEIDITPRDEGFDVIALGSAWRDYQTLCDAVRGTDLRVLLIAGDSAMQGVDVPDNVEVRSGLSRETCRELQAATPITAVPIQPGANAAGQVTFVYSMSRGRAIVATDNMGMRDYLTNGQSAILVPEQDAPAMRDALLRLRDNPSEATALGSAARAVWRDQNSDPAAGKHLIACLDRVFNRTQPSPAF